MVRRYNALFLCTENSARSIMAEAILNQKGRPNFTAHSAGSHPAGVVRPEALKQIQQGGQSVGGLRSKSWDEFARPGAPQLDFVFTVCDNAANEVCPLWPGQPTGVFQIPPLKMERRRKLNARFTTRICFWTAGSHFFCLCPLPHLVSLRFRKK